MYFNGLEWIGLDLSVNWGLSGLEKGLEWIFVDYNGLEWI